MPKSTQEEEQRQSLLRTDTAPQEEEKKQDEKKLEEIKHDEKHQHEKHQHEKPHHEKKKSDQLKQRKLFANITIEYVCNVDTKSETFDTRFFFRFEWTPLPEEKSKYEEELVKAGDTNISEEDEERRFRKIFVCPTFRYPTAKDFEIIKDDRIKFDKAKDTLKGGYLIKATILEQLELRNFPLDVQHFSIIIECVNTLDQFEFAPRTTAKNDKRLSFSEGKKTPDNKFLRLRSENVILSDFHLKHILGEITQSSENQASQANRQHTILFVSVVMERVGETYIIRLGLFLFILCGSGLSTWSVESLDNRLNMLCTLLLTIVALQMVVNSTVPNIPYLTLLDKYTIFTVFFNFMLILETSFIGIGHAYDSTTDGIFFFLFLAFFLLFHVWFIHYCYRKKTKEEDIKYTQCRHERDDYYEDDEHLKANEELCVDAERPPVRCTTRSGASYGKKYYDTTLNPLDTDSLTASPTPRTPVLSSTISSSSIPSN